MGFETIMDSQNKIQREIKFRFWIKESKQMYPIDSVRDWSGFGDSYDNEVEEGSVVLMQYTGKKDNNGKEIYSWDRDWETFVCFLLSRI